jgi:hypothetical protein
MKFGTKREISFQCDHVQNGMSAANRLIYSYRTSGQRWINHEWLAEVIFARLYNLSGPVYLVGFKVQLSMLLIGLSYIHLVRRGLGPYRSVLSHFLICIPYRIGVGTIRLQIFTYLLFFVELLLHDRAETGRERWLWVLPCPWTANNLDWNRNDRTS